VVLRLVVIVVVVVVVEVVVVGISVNDIGLEEKKSVLTDK
jgi:hypothetical protein